MTTGTPATTTEEGDDMSYHFGATISTGFDQAVEDIPAQLKEQASAC